MRYTTFAIDNSRDHYTVPLRQYLNDKGWDYQPIECVDGSDAKQLEIASITNGYPINFPGARVGHLGIWYSVLNALEYAPIVTFEDDAILGDDFYNQFLARTYDIPDNLDFMSLFIPRDSDYLWKLVVGRDRKDLTPVYANYGGVSMLYTERGAQKIKALLSRDGITDQYDNTLYRYAKAGELNGWCSKPALSDLVYITGQENSIVQESKLYE